jgi:potassium/hydrogen antiporter
VFTAGIALGDEPAPFKREIERFHAALASLAEIVAFVALGLTVDLAEIARPDVWIPGSSWERSRRSSSGRCWQACAWSRRG